MAVFGEAERLGTDAAGAIQNAKGAMGKMPSQERLKHCGLPMNRRIPIVEEEVIELGEIVVERDGAGRHGRQGSALDDVQRKAGERRFLVARLHVETRAVHGLDHLVE